MAGNLTLGIVKPDAVEGGKLGAILQPLNWRLSVAELARAVADTGPVVLVHGPEFRSQARALAVDAGPTTIRHRIALEPSQEELGERVLAFSTREQFPELQPPALSLEPDAPWVLCPTGGSTGLPKAR